MADLQTYNARPSGIAPDLNPANVGPERYHLASNIVFRADKAERQEGLQERSPAPLFAPEQMVYRNLNGVNQWLYAGQDGIGLDVNSQHDITPPGYPANLAVGGHDWCDLNSIPIWNHRDFVPHYHDGGFSNAMQPLPGWPSGWYANRMTAYKFFLIAIGGGEGAVDIDNQIRWSASADPGNVPAEWLPSATNDAGDMSFADTPGAVIDTLPLRDMLIVYKHTSAYRLQFVGGTFVMQQSQMLQKTGILATDCAAVYRNRHYVVTEGDIIVHDGTRSESVVSDKVQRQMFRDISALHKDRAFTYIDPRGPHFCFCYPSRVGNGWCDRRWRMQLEGERAGEWSYEDLSGAELSDAKSGAYTLSGGQRTWETLGYTWETWPGQWSDQAVGTIGNRILEAAYGDGKLLEPTDGGLRMGEVVEAELLWLTHQLNPGRAALIDHVWPVVAPGISEGLEMQVGVTNDYDELPEWLPPVDCASQSGCDVGLRGRYVSIRIAGRIPQAWSIDGFDIDWRDGGRW